MPFCGDGDIAAELYGDRTCYAADLDPSRVATASKRLTGETVVTDCDTFAFPECLEKFAVADFDAYVNPYLALASFWSAAQRTDPIVIFGTDGQRMGIKRSKKTTSLPGCRYKKNPGWRKQYNSWWFKTVLPWLSGLVAPSTIIHSAHYCRAGETYWGIVAGARPDRTGPDTSDQQKEIDDALFGAAVSGNVEAIKAWQSRQKKLAPISGQSAPRVFGRPFVPGQSGNPAGRAKIPRDVVDACRALTEKAIMKLEQLMESGEPDAVQVRAAEALLDRAWGRPAQSVQIDPTPIAKHAVLRFSLTGDDPDESPARGPPAPE